MRISERISESINVDLLDATVERISFDGDINFDKTMTFYVNDKKFISKRALMLGIFLAICHILDGVLTFFGMEIFGSQAEGNSFLRYFIEIYGHGTTLFVGKTIAIILTLTLMLISHKRLWVRNMITGVIVIYLCMAVIPWFYILSRYIARI